MILFDLDNTLLQTDSLEQFRKFGKEAKFEPYEKDFNDSLDVLKSNFHPPKSYNPYYFNREFLENIKKRNILLGVVTKSPRNYAIKVLEKFYPSSNNMTFFIFLLLKKMRKIKRLMKKEYYLP